MEGKIPGDERGKQKERRIAEERFQITNVAWLSIPTGAMLTSIALAIHWYNCEQTKAPPPSVEGLKHLATYTELDDWQQEWQDYRTAGILYCASALIETLAEPLVILYAMRNLDVKTRAAAEASGALAKAIVIVVLLSPSGRIPSWIHLYPVTVFGIGQVIHAIIFSSIFYFRKWNCISWPSLQSSANSFVESIRSSFHWPTIRITVSFAVQGIFKHLLTEGDRIMLTALAQGYDQGLYAMAQAYGGMASRLLFQPLEENARLLFSRQHRLIVEAASRKSDRMDADTATTSTRAKKDLEQTLCVLVKLVLYIGLLFACLASNYTPILLRMLAGSKWSSSGNASSVLSAFCIYTALLALNGMTEAFVYGVAQSGEDVAKLGLAHAAVGAIFAVTAPLLVRTHKTVGIVAANGLSMALRSAYALYFAAGYFTTEESSSSKVAGKTRWAALMRLAKSMSPRTPVVFAFLFSFLMTRHSLKLNSEAVGAAGGSDVETEVFVVAAAKHIGIGLLCALTTLAIAVRTEKQFRMSIMQLVRVKHD